MRCEIILSNSVIPYSNSFWINQVQIWIKVKYGDIGRFTYILELLEQGKPLYQSDQMYMFKKLEQQRFQQQYSHLSSTNKEIKSLHQIQLEHNFISEQIHIKQAELDEINSKIKSMQEIPTENYLISEQIHIKQAELDEINSKIKSMQEKQAECEHLEQIQIKQDKFQTLDKQIHSKTYDRNKKVRKKNILFNSPGEQYDKYGQQQNETFLFLCKLRSDIKTLQSDKSKLDKKINTIKDVLDVFDIHSS